MLQYQKNKTKVFKLLLIENRDNSKLQKNSNCSYLQSIDYISEVRNKLNSDETISNLKLDRDDESLSIYLDFGEDEEIYPICYWHIDEWLEDAEGVVGAMLSAMELFYLGKHKTLFEILGIEYP